MIGIRKTLGRALCWQRSAELSCRLTVSRLHSTTTTGGRSSTSTPEVEEAQIIEDHEDEPAPMPMQDRTVKELYRDCIRLTYHLGGISKKGDAMRQMVRSFETAACAGSALTLTFRSLLCAELHSATLCRTILRRSKPNSKLQVRAQFGKYADETDPEVIEARRQDAIRGLSNYLIYSQHGGQQGLEKLSRGDKSKA